MVLMSDILRDLQEKGIFEPLCEIDLAVASSYKEVYENVYKIMCRFDEESTHGCGEYIQACNSILAYCCQDFNPLVRAYRYVGKGYIHVLFKHSLGKVLLKHTQRF